MKITLKSFPNHLGRPGQEGGSKPRGTGSKGADDVSLDKDSTGGEAAGAGLSKVGDRIRTWDNTSFISQYDWESDNITDTRREGDIIAKNGNKIAQIHYYQGTVLADTITDGHHNGIYGSSYFWSIGDAKRYLEAWLSGKPLPEGRQGNMPDSYREGPNNTRIPGRVRY